MINYSKYSNNTVSCSEQIDKTHNIPVIKTEILTHTRIRLMGSELFFLPDLTRQLQPNYYVWYKLGMKIL